MYVKAGNKSLILVSGSKNMKKEEKERNRCLQYVDFFLLFLISDSFIYSFF